jgi:hypothetical protein
MNRGVRRVLELLHEQVLVRLGRGEFLGLRDRSLHALRPGGQHEFRTERDQHFAPLHAHRLGHRQHALVAAGCRRERERNPGIAAGRLDDRHARLQRAAPLGIPYHRRSDAAFYRVGRIAPLDLRQYRRAESGAQTIDANQGRVTDRLGIVFIYCHAAPPKAWAEQCLATQGFSS